MKLIKFILLTVLMTLGTMTTMTTSVLAVEVTISKENGNVKSHNNNNKQDKVTIVTAQLVPQKKKRQGNDVDEKAAPPNAAVLAATIQNQNQELASQLDLVQSPIIGPGYPVPGGGIGGIGGIGVGLSGSGPVDFGQVGGGGIGQDSLNYGSPPQLAVQPGVITTSGIGIGGIGGGFLGGNGISGGYQDNFPRPGLGLGPNPNINLFPALNPQPLPQVQIQPVINPVPRYNAPFIPPPTQQYGNGNGFGSGGYSNGPVPFHQYYRRPQNVGFGSIISTNYPQFVQNTYRHGQGFNYQNYYNFRPGPGFQGGNFIQPGFNNAGGISGGNGIVTGGYA